MKKSIKQELKKVLFGKSLPAHDDILELSSSVSNILENEVCSYREKAETEFAGSLLDFQGENQPVIVVPDLHGRTEFLFNIINYKLPKDFLGKSITILKALEKKLVQLVFVGDILHTERNTKMRWVLAQEDFLQGNFTGPSMTEEMAESLSLWYGVFRLKLAFPENCHILKGNHENILNVSSNGDFSFRKYANEGAMVKAFMQEYYGDDVLYMVHCVEDALPLVVVGNKCVISHAEPSFGFSKEQIVNGKMYPEVVAGLTWTDNDQAEEGSVLTVIKNLSNSEDVSDYVYLGGHRCVTTNYEYRQNGLFIQIHNPGRQNIALVYNDKKFNPDTDIVGVDNGK